MSPDLLQPWADNPRDNHDSVARVVASIKRFGFGAPIVARRENLEIIAGHTRWFAARQLQLVSVPVRLLDISEYEAHLLALTDNRLTERTEWSDKLPELLARYELSDVQLAGWDDLPMLSLAGSGADGELGESTERSLAFDVFPVAMIADAQVESMLNVTHDAYALTTGDVMVELNRCAAGGKPLVGCADRWFPHRYDVLAGQSKHTPNDTLRDAVALRGVVEMCAKVGRAPNSSAILNASQLYHGRQGARQFPIHVARDVYARYSRQNAAVLDPCAGWGGRLLGWLCARQGGTYYGVDASSQTVSSFGRMIGDLNIHNATIEHSAFEDIEFEPNTFDFAFTSPPYFNVERYSADAEQSCVRYLDYDSWRLGFLEPLVRLTLRALRPGCAFALNVSDARENQIARDATAIARELGADIELSAKIDVGGGAPAGNMGMVGTKEDLILMRKRT